MKSIITLACKTTFVCLMAMFFSQHLKAQTIIYVDSANVSGTHNGISWATAYNNLATAITAATSGTQVWVAKGTYQPASNASFQPTADNVKIYGGFPGYPNTTAVFSNRNSSTNVTILKGNGAPVVYYTATTPAITTATVLDGFTITGATNLGGIYTLGNPTLSNLIITGNSTTSGSYGGGLTVSGSSPILTNVTISNNSAINGGGGGILFANGGATPLMTPVLNNVTISGNTATADGGGISWSTSTNNNYSLTLNGVNFINNTANGSQGGGGLYINQTGGNTLFSLDSVVFDGNKANGAYGMGGAIYVNGLNASGSRMIGTQLVFANNSIPNGITNNAGGAFCDGGSGYIKLTDALFYNNSVTTTSTLGAYGGAFSGGAGNIVNSTDTLINATFVNNSITGPTSSTKGAAIYNYINHSGSQNLYVANSVFYNNSKTISGTTSSSDVEYGATSTPGSLIYSYLQNTATTGTYITANNNLVSTTNPFINSSSPKGTDGVWMTVDDGLHVFGTSAAYNAGSNTIVSNNQINTDIKGSARILLSTVDMGAYETGLGFSLQPVSQIICPGSTQTITFTATASSIISNDVITLQWQKNGVNVGSPVVLSAAPYNTSYSITNATTNDTASYTVVATDATFGSVPSVAKLSTYLQQSVSPATQSVCSGATTATAIVATSRNSNTSNIVQWEYSYSNFSSVGDSVNIASSASSTLTAAQIKLSDSATVYYRALVQNPGCAASYSDTVQVKVIGSDTAYQSQNICTGSSPANLTINDSAYATTIGAIAKWQYSSNPSFSGFTNITNTKFSLPSSIMGTLTTARYYRAVITPNAASGCNGKTAYSNVIAIGINPVSVGGTASSTTPTICSGSTAPLTLTGYTGTIQSV